MCAHAEARGGAEAEAGARAGADVRHRALQVRHVLLRFHVCMFFVSTGTCHALFVSCTCVPYWSDALVHGSRLISFCVWLAIGGW